MPRYRKKPAGTPRKVGPPGLPGLAAYPRAVTITRICDVMALGFPLSAVLQMPGMPTVDLVMKWQRKDPAIRQAIAEAREMGADAMAEECLQIADEATPVSVQVAKLRIGTRLRLAGAWAPGTYGRPEQQTSPPVTVTINWAAMGVSLPKPAIEVSTAIDVPADESGE